MRFAIVFGGTLALLLLLVGAFNAVVNPYAIYGTTMFEPAASNDLERAVAMVENPELKPELVVLGSSRSSRLRPKDLECFSGMLSANASFSNATPDAIFALAHYMLETKPAPKLMILGVDVEAFQDPSHFGNRLATVPRLGKYAQANALQGWWFDATQLISYGQLNDSVRTVVHSLQPTPAPTDAAEAEDTKNAPPIQIIQNSDEDTPPKAGKSYQRRFDGYETLDKQQKEYFRSMLELAHAKNIKLKVFITTFSPTLTKELNSYGVFPKRLVEVKKWLNELQATYPFEFYDFSTIETFGGTEQDFYNLAHINDKNSARLIGAMFTETGRAAKCMPKN